MTSRKLYLTIVAALLTVLGIFYGVRAIEQHNARARAFAEAKEAVTKQLREVSILRYRNDPEFLVRYVDLTSEITNRAMEASDSDEREYWHGERMRAEALLPKED